MNTKTWSSPTPGVSRRAFSEAGPSSLTPSSGSDLASLRCTSDSFGDLLLLLLEGMTTTCSTAKLKLATQIFRAPRLLCAHQQKETGHRSAVVHNTHGR